MSRPNELRNKDIVEKRNADKDYWTWGKLGKLYGITRQAARRIYERDKHKYSVNSYPQEGVA